MLVKKSPHEENIVFVKKNDNSAHAAQCNKSHVLTKVIGAIFDIDSFE